MNLRTIVVIFGSIALAAPAVNRPQAASAKKYPIAFAPLTGAAFELRYEKSETSKDGDRLSQHHIVWTMCDRVGLVTKKGRAFIDGSFLAVDYSVHGVADGTPHDDSFHWSAKHGYSETTGSFAENVGKAEIPKGLHLIVDARGAAEHGEC